jgi:hypothetical protein
MKRRGPSGLLGRNKIATEKAMLVLKIADLEEKLAQLKKILSKPPRSSRSGADSPSLQNAQIRVLPADDRQDRPRPGRLVPRDLE